MSVVDERQTNKSPAKSKGIRFLPKFTYSIEKRMTIFTQHEQILETFTDMKLDRTTGFKK